MNLEGVTLGDIRQPRNDKYGVIPLTWESNVQTQRSRDTTVVSRSGVRGGREAGESLFIGYTR